MEVVPAWGHRPSRKSGGGTGGGGRWFKGEEKSLRQREVEGKCRLSKNH